MTLSQRNIELDPLSFHVAGRRGYVAVCRKSIFGDLVQEWYTIPQLPRVLECCVGETDYWISQAEFATKSRYTKDLLRIQCCYVDLDYYKTDYRSLSPEQVAGLIDLWCGDFSIPRPTIVVSSGNGIQVKWVFTYPLPAQVLPRWRAAQSMLLGYFRDLGADPAAADASRILRVVGTRNGKTLPGRDSLVRIIAEGPKWNFETFCELLLPVTREEAKEARSRSLSAKVQHNRQASEGYPNLVSLDPQTLSWDRVNDLRRLAALRKNERGEVPEGCRELLVFWTLNHLCLSGVVSTHNFEREAMALAREISPSWAESFRIGSLETVRRKLEDGLARYRGRGRTGLYTPKNSTLIESLKITPEEEAEMKTIISSSMARERSRLRNVKRRREAGSLPREIYRVESLTARQPWKTSGMSRATWYRQKKCQNQEAVSADTGPEKATAAREEQAPWVQEGVSRATWYRKNKRNGLRSRFRRNETKNETSPSVYLYGVAQGPAPRVDLVPPAPRADLGELETDQASGP